jgi:nucleoside-diphosphate-sugar epimerase
MKVLLTGSSGFIGSNLLSYIDSQADKSSFDIRILPSFRNENSDNYNYSFTIEDLLQLGLDKIDTLVHAGAFTPKNTNQLNDIKHNTENVMNTEYLLTHLPNIPRKIIYISSISVYNSTNQEIINENTLTCADTLYGLSKLFCERIIQEYSRKNRIECQILRLGVVYGHNLTYSGLIPTVIRNILDDKPVFIFNGGKEIKSYIHVKDCCRVIYESIKKSVRDEIVNVVSAHSIPVKELVRKIIEISGKDISITNMRTDKKTFNTRYDNTVLLNNFGENEISYDVGLNESFNYFEQIYKNRYEGL